SPMDRGMPPAAAHHSGPSFPQEIRAAGPNGGGVSLWRIGLKSHAWMTLLALVTTLGAGSAGAEPVPYRVPPRLADVAQPLDPGEVRLEGYLGSRVANNEKNRLLRVAEAPLLAGFRHRPGEQAWIGEHVGKWLHAATLAW